MRESPTIHYIYRKKNFLKQRDDEQDDTLMNVVSTPILL